MSFIKRLFKIGEASANNIIDSLEDPVKMTEQGIRALKGDLQVAMQSLAEVTAISIRSTKDRDAKIALANEYEQKAVKLLQAGASGSMPQQEADRLATEALQRKEEVAVEVKRLSAEAANNEKMCDTLRTNVKTIKSNISKFENELQTLKARAKTATASRKINEQLSKIDSSGTVAMLERMKSKVEAEENLAIAYTEVAQIEGGGIDADIDKAIASAELKALPSGTSQLDELKKKMGLMPQIEGAVAE